MWHQWYLEWSTSLLALFRRQCVQYTTTGEALLANSELEVCDLFNDPNETRNLAIKPQAIKSQAIKFQAIKPQPNKAPIFRLNNNMNRLIAEEVGVDDGPFLPIRNGNLLLAAVSEHCNPGDMLGLPRAVIT